MSMWESKFSPTHNQYYYTNSSDTTWTRPSDYISGPDDFEEGSDPSTGATYYYDKTTSESSWERPSCWPPVKEGGMVPVSPPPRRGKGKSLGQVRSVLEWKTVFFRLIAKSPINYVEENFHCYWLTLF